MSSLRQIEREYDPENDIVPGQISVNWVDYELLHAIRKMQERIEELESRVSELEGVKNVD